MPNHRMTGRKVLCFAAAAVLAMFLAYLSERFMDHYPTIQTPGEYIAQRAVPVPPSPNELSTLGPKILLAFAIDSACYFVLIWGVSAITRKFRNKPPI
jgi:hypothetical protein